MVRVLQPVVRVLQPVVRVQPAVLLLTGEIRRADKSHLNFDEFLELIVRCALDYCDLDEASAAQ